MQKALIQAPRITEPLSRVELPHLVVHMIPSASSLTTSASRSLSAICGCQIPHVTAPSDACLLPLVVLWLDACGMCLTFCYTSLCGAYLLNAPRCCESDCKNSSAEEDPLSSSSLSRVCRRTSSYRRHWGAPRGLFNYARVTIRPKELLPPTR